MKTRLKEVLCEMASCKLILSDFASRSKQGLNKAELFILPSISVVVSSNRRFYYFAFKIKEEFAMRLSPER